MQAHILPHTGPQTHGSAGQEAHARQVQGFAGIESVSEGFIERLLTGELRLILKFH